MVDAQYAPSADGEPVYPEYSDELHLAAEELRPVPRIPIRLGLDHGVQRPV